MKKIFFFCCLVLLALPATSHAQAQTLSKRDAQAFTKTAFPSFAPELIFKDERSRVFLVQRIRVESAKKCDRVDKFAVDCAFSLRMVGTSPESGEKPDKTTTDCKGTLRTRRALARLNGRLRDFSCNAVSGTAPVPPLPAPNS